MASDLDAFVADFEHMIHRAERNAALFHDIAFKAHCETLQDSDLPELLAKKILLEHNMQVFANEPDELDRLEDCHEFIMRQIQYLQQKGKKASNLRNR